MDFNIPEMIERIKERCALKELEPLGFSSATISTWKKNNRPPRSDDLYTISQYVGCTMEYLLTGKKDADSFPDDIQKTAVKLSALSPKQREPIIATVNALVEYWKKEIKSQA